jgi:hypothetical protein
MKRLLSVFLLANALLWAQTANSANLTLVPPATATSPAIVQVSLQNSPGSAPAAIQFTVGATKDVTGIVATIGAAGTAANKLIGCGAWVNSSLTCIVYGVNATAIGNGVIASLSVNLVSGLGVTSEPLTLTPVSMADGNAVAVAATSSGASIPVSSACDFNGDGVIDMKDIQLVLSQAIGGAGACTAAGDINKDGKCDVFDVARVVIAVLPVGTTGVTNPGICKVGP